MVALPRGNPNVQVTPIHKKIDSKKGPQRKIPIRKCRYESYCIPV
jgi:hypothetical protein